MVEDGWVHSSQGFRRTRRFYKRFLARSGVAHVAIAVYRRRGTTVARFLSRDPTTQWLAIHVYQYRKHTEIYVVSRPRKPSASSYSRFAPLTATTPKGKEPVPLGDRLTAGRQTLDLSI